MTVTAVRKDPQTLTMTVEAEFAASPERVWQLWADPRQLERWWGPPTYPATFTKHDLAPGSRIEYHMTGPEGDQPKGYWDIVEVDPPNGLAFRDGFANDDGSPNTELPQNTASVRIEAIGNGRTRMSIETAFPSTEAMEQRPRHGHGTGSDPGHRPDRRDPRRGGRPQGMRPGEADEIRPHEQSVEQDPQSPGKETNVTTTTTAEPTTHTLDVPGATLTYDVRRNEQSTEPILLLIGSPMGAAGFGTLAKHFPDRTIVTYDPRGTERSRVTDPTSAITPEIHADDVHRVIEAIGGGPVDLFATSGGAVNALALVAKHPEQVRTVVAHEPPLPAILPDREHAVAATRAIQRDLHAEWRERRHGSLHRYRQPPRSVHRRGCRPAGTGPTDVRDAGGRRWLPDRPDVLVHDPRHHRVRA